MDSSTPMRSSANANGGAKNKKRTPTNPFRAKQSTYGVSIHGVPKKRLPDCDGMPSPTASCKRAKRPAVSIDNDDAEPHREAKRVKEVTPTPHPMERVDAIVPLRRLSRALSLRALRTRLGPGHFANIFDMAREEDFGNVGPEHQEGLRKMFHKMVKDTKDGSDTAANAEYFVQILEEGSDNGEGEQEFSWVVLEMFKMLVILISLRKPPPAASEADSLKFAAMAPQQVLDIVSKEVRDAMRESIHKP